MDDATPAALRLEAIDERRFVAPNEGSAEIHDVVFGGQLLGQSIVAAARCHPELRVRSIQTIFARTARVSGATELHVDPMHSGRSFASHTITAWQGDRLCARSLVLLDVDEPDLIRHAPPMPDVAGPDDSADGGARGAVFPGSELRIVDDVDLYSLDAPVGSADLFLWTRFADAPDDVTINQAVLAWATDGYLIATAMRPHAGINQNAAHRTISTGVLAQTVVFHEQFTARDWLLIAHHSTAAGRGRSYGRADVFDCDGTLVASFTQTNMIRAMPDATAGGGGRPPL